MGRIAGYRNAAELARIQPGVRVKTLGGWRRGLVVSRSEGWVTVDWDEGSEATGWVEEGSGGTMSECVRSPRSEIRVELLWVESDATP